MPALRRALDLTGGNMKYAVWALCRVAGDFPEAVADATPALVERLIDEDPIVRKNACRALGHLEAGEAEGPLWERARNDDREVCERAQWALTRIDGWN